MNCDSTVFPETLDLYSILYQSVRILITSFRDQVKKKSEREGKRTTENGQMPREKALWVRQAFAEKRNMRDRDKKRDEWLEKESCEIKARPEASSICLCDLTARIAYVWVGMYVCIYVYVTYRCCLDSVLAQWVSLCLTSRRTYIFSCLATFTHLYKRLIKNIIAYYTLHFLHYMYFFIRCSFQ